MKWIELAVVRILPSCAIPFYTTAVAWYNFF